MKTGILKVTETKTTDVEAIGASLNLSISGENMVFGNAAYEKSFEVKNLVDAVKCRIGDGIKISIVGVSIELESGWVSKATKGSYSIRIDISNLDMINKVLSILVGVRNVKLHSIDWKYDVDEIKLKLTKEAMVSAKRKADAMADAVGLKIGGIISCSDSYQSPDTNIPPRGLMRLGVSDRNANYDVDLGAEICGRKKISTVVTVEFLVINNITQASDTLE